MNTQQPFHGQERPRERLLQHGPQVLTTPELLAVILGTGAKGRDAVQFSAELLNQFSGLRNLLSAEHKTLRNFKGMGDAKICQLQAINELASRSMEEELRHSDVLSNSQLVKRYCINRLGHLSVEHCIAIYLDARYRLICSKEVSRGTLTRTSVYPREVAIEALKLNAAAVILSHNHPSGVAEASDSDISLTKHLHKALALIDVSLLDHIVVSSKDATSMSEQGLL
jgi:DNA repair protein RadC